MKLKAFLAAAFVAGAGTSAWAEDEPDEKAVAFGEAEFWLGGDEVDVASGEGEFWLGPDEIAVASDEKTFWLVPACQPVGEGSYVFVKDGNCTIFGSGVATNLPAGFDLNSITNAVVENGITEIGARFFKKCSKLNVVTLGDDVTSVGTNAFYLCVSLEKIKVGNAAAVDSLKGAVVYRAAINPDGTPYVIPYIDAPGYKNVLYATDDLANPNWHEIDPADAFANGASARFFKYVLEPVPVE